jgi:hypothetical protein
VCYSPSKPFSLALTKSAPLQPWGNLMPSEQPGLTHLLNITTAGCWWLIPVILATQEAEIRRTSVKKLAPGK